MRARSHSRLKACVKAIRNGKTKVSILTSVAQAARSMRVERWPVVGETLQMGGRALAQLWHGGDGVPATVDGQVRVRLSPRAFSGGSYGFDPSLTAVLRTYAESGRPFLDIGAHVGMASMIYAGLTDDETRVIAIEPNPHVFPILVENSRVNGMRIECFRVAFGAAAGAVKFFVSGRDPNASLSREAPGKYWYWAGRDKPSLQECRVTMTTVDQFCEALAMTPGFMKLDVEGAELDVLRGAAGMLRKCRPLILLETHVFAWESFGCSAEALHALIRELKYRVCDSSGAPFDGPLGVGPERDNNHFLLMPE